MPVVGAIATAARGILPVTWDALSRDAQRFGDALLQQAVDVTKEVIFGTIIPVGAEANYPLRVIRYAGRLVALELIEPGIDFWMNELLSESASGTNEVHTFTDRADKLRQLGDRLGILVRAEEADVLALLGRPKLKRIPRMGISTPKDDLLLTPSPREFPAPFGPRTGTQRLT